MLQGLEPDGTSGWTSARRPAGATELDALNLKLALQMAKLGTYRRDILRQRVHYSPFVSQILGLPAREHEESVDEALKRVHPDDRPILDALAVRDDAGSGGYLEYRVVRPSGEVRWISVRNQILTGPRGGGAMSLAVVGDVTDRRLAEQVRAEDEERLKLAIELGKLATWRRDFKRDVYHYSAIAAALFGLPPQEFEEPTAAAVLRVHPDDRPAVIANAHAGGIYGEPGGISEYRMLRADGVVRWLSVRNRILRDVDGVPTISVCVARDITEDRAAAVSIRESRERLELALEGADLGTWDTDLVTGVTSFDARGAALMGRPAEGFLTKGDWADLVHHDDLPALGRSWVAHLKAGVGSSEAEFRIRDGACQWRWIRSRGRVISRDLDGRAVRAAGTYMDVSDQKNAALRLAAAQADMAALFNNSRDRILLVDPSFGLIHFNEAAGAAWRAMFNHELCHGENLLDTIDRPAAKRFREEIAAVAAAKVPRGLECSLQARDGAVPHELEFVPVILSDGTLRGIGITARDISARKANEAILAETQRLESLGRLVGGVAHDFNNLLGVILGFGELAAESIGEAHPARDDIQQVVSAAQSAAGLTRQLLTFARRQHIEPTDVDLNQLVAKLHKMLDRLLGESVAFHCLLAPSPVVARIDAGQFEQVVVNLAANARDAMPDGGRLTVTTRVADSAVEALGAGVPAGRYAVVEVRDTGTGMTPATMAQMFEPFYTTKDAGKGTGLGLATCHGIVTQAGGHLTATSALGSGSTFRILLPLAQAQSIETPAAGSTPARSVEAPAPMCALVVEDQAEVRAVAGRSLSAAGYRVLSAAGPIQALDLAANHDDISLIVSDLVMPVMDGVQMVELITALVGPIAVIFMSGYADSALILASRGRPNAHFLAKPFAPSDLVALANAALAAETRATS